MYWVLFILFTIGFLAMVYNFYPQISSYIRKHIDSRNVLEVKEKIREVDNEERKKEEENGGKEINNILIIINKYLNMPYEFVKKMFD